MSTISGVLVLHLILNISKKKKSGLVSNKSNYQLIMKAVWLN